MSDPEFVPDSAAIIDGIPGHVALIDGNGMICSVNRRWQDFSAPDALSGERFGIGTNYIEACEAAAVSFGEHAAAIAAGLRKLLAGEASHFNKEYPCHEPEKQRWFHLYAAPISSGRGAIVIHFNTTAHISTRSELKNSQALLQLASDMSNLGAWQITLPDETVYLSEEVERILGISSSDSPTVEQLIAMLFPQFQEVARTAYTQCRDHGEPFDFSGEIVSRNGQRLWVRVIGQAQSSADGTVHLVHGAFQDITGSKELEQSLLASEEKSRQLADHLYRILNSMTDALLTFDRDWHLTFLNREAERLLQRGSHALIGRSLHHIFPEKATGNMSKLLQDAMSRMETASFQAFHSARGIWFAVRAYPADEGMTVYLRDITAEREKDLRIREQAALLDKAKDAIILRDLDHRIIFWNKGAERIYGWKREEVLGKVIAKLLYAEVPIFYAATEHTLTHGEWTGQIEHLTRKGETVTIDANWTLLRDDDGKPSAILAINTNVTERKKIEDQYYRAQRLESIGTLASGVAHDLNNLLAPVVMGVELLRSAKNGTDIEPIIRSIELSAQRGTELVKQILSFAKGIDGTLSPLEIPDILREVESIVHNTFPKNVVFTLECQPDLARVLGDATRLNQVFLNICVNARDAMADGGVISITARNETVTSPETIHNHDINPGTYVRVDIADTGCGIPRNCIDKIFDPFFTTKPPGNGTGLGLATSQGIVRSHNGFITVTSKPGQGSCFSIFIPAHESAKPVLDEPRGEQHPTPSGNGQTVLVVDDEAPIVEVTQQILTSNGYQAIPCTDGAEAVALFAVHQQQIDLVLTDLMMPGIDGPALIAAIRRIDPTVKIIATSGLHTSRQMVKAGEFGIQQFLVKPYSASRLLAAVNATINPRQER